MSFGLLIVCSDISACAEVIGHGKYGLNCAPDTRLRSPDTLKVYIFLSSIGKALWQNHVGDPWISHGMPLLLDISTYFAITSD